jgi:hypothetical protein
VSAEQKSKQDAAACMHHAQQQSTARASLGQPDACLYVDMCIII